MKCYQCCEEINDDAKKCRFCHSILIKSTLSVLRNILVFLFLLPFFAIALFYVIGNCIPYKKEITYSDVQWTRSDLLIIGNIHYSLMDRRLYYTQDGSDRIGKIFVMTFAVTNKSDSDVTCSQYEYKLKDKDGNVIFSEIKERCDDIPRGDRIRPISIVLENGYVPAEVGSVEIKCTGYKTVRLASH